MASTNHQLLALVQDIETKISVTSVIGAGTCQKLQNAIPENRLQNPSGIPILQKKIHKTIYFWDNTYS